MPTTTLVDGNSVGYAEHYATKLKSGDLETQAIFGYVRRMRDLKVGYPNCTPVVLWDGRADWRFDLCPDYKSNREDNPQKVAIRKAYVAQRPYIRDILRTLGIRQMTATHHEADDLAGYLTKKLTEASPDNRVVLLTGDHDWYQLVRPGVQVRDIKNNDFYLVERNFTDKTGYRSPMAFLEGKALQGDTSDVISGVGGIGETGAREFLANWGSVNDFYKAINAGTYTPAARKSKDAKTPHPEQVLASAEGKKTFLRNLKMMQLINVVPPEPKDLTIIRAEPNKDKFAELCEELNFSTYLKDLDNFFKPFEG